MIKATRGPRTGTMTNRVIFQQGTIRKWGSELFATKQTGLTCVPPCVPPIPSTYYCLSLGLGVLNLGPKIVWIEVHEVVWEKHYIFIITDFELNLAFYSWKRTVGNTSVISGTCDFITSCNSIPIRVVSEVSKYCLSIFWSTRLLDATTFYYLIYSFVI